MIAFNNYDGDVVFRKLKNKKLDDSLLFKGWMDYDYYTDKFKEWNGEPQGYSSDIVEVKTETEEIL